MSEPASDNDRHFWRPSSDNIRHAFRGRRWDRRVSDTSVCGADVELWASVTDEQWVMAASCAACNALLQRERAESVEPDEHEQESALPLRDEPRHRS